MRELSYIQENQQGLKIRNKLKNLIYIIDRLKGEQKKWNEVPPRNQSAVNKK